jgi:transglutaminase/protease-like cytokinesis protein 3
LTEKNKAIFDACFKVISGNITDGMTAYEKELAIHDWIVKWASYDTEANNNSPNARPSPDNDNPYGVFFNKKAICSGYTSTFQLFMDLLGIECITVNGFARNMETEHAWNMVRLDGEWYCVDVTWNDPVGVFSPSYVSHDYFNVTSQYMREHQHIWNDAAVPEATATAYSWENMSG